MSSVITYGDSRGNKIYITPKMERAFKALGSWPTNDVGEEYCQVQHGAHLGYPSPLVIVETMPDHLRGSHRAAGNWGVYPHNGAERLIRFRDEAQELVDNDPDGYASIVEDFGLDEGGCENR